MRDPYVVLNVARTASASEIKAAYRRIAKLYHPDRNQGDKQAEQRFKEASHAYKLLGDEDRRRNFDQGVIDADGRPAFAANAASRKSKNPFKGKSENDNSDLFSGIFGRDKKAGNTPQGRDLRSSCSITFLEAESGSRKRITLADGKTLEVNIPPKVTNGQVLRLRGQGLKGRDDSASGDALIELLIEPHPLLHREGLNVYMDLPLSIPEALKGTTVIARTADGQVKIKIPSRSNTGTTLRLKGKGLSDTPHKKIGDLYVRIIVYLPEEADKEFAGFAESWSKRARYQPRAKFDLFEN